MDNAASPKSPAGFPGVGGGAVRGQVAAFRRPCPFSLARFAHRAQQIVFQEYVDAVKEAQARIKGLDQALQNTLERWSREGETRGVNTLTAVTTLACLLQAGRTGGPHPL